MNKKLIIIISVVVLALIGGCYLLTNKKADNTVNFEKTTVGRANISTSVTATGTVEAVTTVDVGTQVSGIVTNLYVDYNSPVK